jgi:predicted transposase/invertase (TIGR01784 family)
MFDNVSKFLAQTYSQDFSSWLLGREILFTELKPRELSLEPLRADSLILLKSARVILHIEMQTDPDEDMGFRMADYALRIYRKFPNHELIQIVIYLRKTTSPKVFQTTWQGNNLVHQFQVVRLWEQPTDQFLSRPGLLPYAVLSQTDDREAVLRTVARQINEMTDRSEQSNIASISAVMAGLSLEKNLIQRILRREIMKESVIYQEWMTEWQEEGEAIGLKKGLKKGLKEGKAEGVVEASRSLVTLLLNQKLGTVPSATLDRVLTLSPNQLESLAIALLNFNEMSDLTTWLDDRS